MKWKGIGWILAVVVVLGTLNVPVAAAEEKNDLSGWQVSYALPNQEQQEIIGSGYKPIQEETTYAVRDEAVYYGGKSSLAVYYPDSRQGWTFLNIRAEVTEDITYGNYNMRFCVKNLQNPDAVQVGIVYDMDLETGSLVRLNNPRFQVTEIGEGWSEYKICVTYDDPNERTGYFHILVDNQAMPVYLDEICLSREGSQENLLKNGGLEYIVPEKQYDPREIYGARVFQENGGLGISWRNPSGGNIISAELYAEEPKQRRLLSDTFNLNCGAVNEYFWGGLENGKEYSLCICIGFSEGTTCEQILFGVPGTSGENTFFEKWDIQANRGEREFSPIFITPDTLVKKEGNVSARIVSNLKGIEPNVFFELRQDVTLETGKTYQLDFWGKGKQANNVKTLYGWSTFDGEQYAIVQDTNETFDWKHYTFTKTCGAPSSNNSLQFMVENSTEAFWLDDVKLREVKADGSFGENLLANPGFEEGLVKPVPEELLDLSVLAIDSGAVFELENSEDSRCVKTIIYEEREGVLYPRAEVAPNRKKVQIGGLKNNKVYTFVVKNVNTFGRESNGISVGVTPKADDLKITQPRLYSFEEEQAVLTPGVFQVKTSVKNNGMGTGFEASLIAAVYRGDEMIALYSQKKTVEQSESTLPAEEYELNIEIPDEECRLEIFVWDSLEGRKILFPKKIYEKQV